MRFKFLIIVALALMVPVVLAYSTFVTLDSNVGSFNTDIYECSNSDCDGLSFHLSSSSGSSTNVYTLSGSGDDYYLEFNYVSCFKPHIYQIHIWDPYTNPNSFFREFLKMDDCVGSIVSGGLSGSVIELGENVVASSSVRSAWELPVGIPSTSLIPSSLEDEYSTLIKAEFFANGVKIGEDENSVLMGTSAGFEFDWTPLAAGSYDITVVSSVTDCACSAPNPQTSYIGSVLVNDNSCSENIVNSSWGAWVNVSSCVGGWMSQERTLTEYDDNSCGTFSDVVHTEYRSIICDMPCTPNIVNETSWGDWVNDSSCVNNWMNQSRTLIEYDENSCGTVANVTHIGYRSVVCDMPCTPDVVNGSWSAWVNVSSCDGVSFGQIRTVVEFDNNSCGVFNDVSYNETREVNCSLPSCSVDSNCSADYYGDKYCVGDEIWKDFHDFSCVNGSCVEDVDDEFVKECSDECDDGKCVSDNSWDDRSVIWNDRSVSGVVSNLVLKGEVEDGSWIWLWILLLIILILFLAWMILRILRA